MSGSKVALLLVLALAMVGGQILLLAAGQGATSSQAVTGPEYSIDIVGGTEKPPQPGQTPPPIGCSSKIPSVHNCSVPAGSQFTVKVFLNKTTYLILMATP